MKVSVKLDSNNQLPAAYGKFANPEDFKNHYPLRSFPIQISELPAQTRTWAFTFTDPDSIPVCGFSWIHWSGANLPAEVLELPANASQQPPVAFLQGKNSTISSFIGETDPTIYEHYVGPTPPDQLHRYELRVYAVDQILPLTNGFWLNELQHALTGHILAHVKIILPYRA